MKEINSLSSLDLLMSPYIKLVGYNPVICIVMQISCLFIPLAFNMYCEVMLINEMQQIISTWIDFYISIFNKEYACVVLWSDLLYNIFNVRYACTSKMPKQKQ
jgi:hypothetical protein